jgi:multicomponent Na+:H+ antiporter subunit D
MALPAGALVCVGLALTVLAGPIYGYAQRAADSLTDGHSYQQAVRDSGGSRVPAGDVAEVDQ